MRSTNRLRRWITRGVIAVTLLILIVAIGSRTLLTPLAVSGPSMTPTYEDGATLFINRLAFKYRDPKVNDIVVFNVEVPYSTKYIKRVIAVAGQEVDVRDGRVFVNGVAIDEPYLADGETTECYATSCALIVPEGTVYVLGDNRDESFDSRELGPIAFDDLVGTALDLLP